MCVRACVRVGGGGGGGGEEREKGVVMRGIESNCGGHLVIPISFC